MTPMHPTRPTLGTFVGCVAGVDLYRELYYAPMPKVRFFVAYGDHPTQWQLLIKNHARNITPAQNDACWAFIAMRELDL